LLVRLGASCSLVDGSHRTNVHFVVSHRPIPLVTVEEDRYPFLGRGNPRRSGRGSRIGGMTAERAGGVLLIVGSAVFFVGAAIGVPGVFTQTDPQIRLRMLTERLRAWQVAQPLYGVGPGITAAGVGLLAAASGGGSGALLAASCWALAVGAVSWGWSLYLRGTRVSDFAFGTLPSWPFATYVLVTIAGIALLALGLLTGDFPVWLGWVTLTAGAFFLVGYLRFRDIPPFVFYVPLTGVGVAVL
jgi:hypothetical protein